MIVTNSVRTSILVVTLISAIGSSTNAQVKHFRYALRTRTGERKFVNQLAVVPPSGGYYDVTFDSDGRMQSWAVCLKGSCRNRYEYRMTGTNLWTYTGTRGNDTVSTGTLIYNGDHIVRETEDVPGDSGFSWQKWRHYSDDSVVVEESLKSGIKRLAVQWFNEQGILVRERQYPNAETLTTWYDVQLDQRSGLAVSQDKIVDGKLALTTRMQYDDDGLQTRRESFDPSGKRFQYSEFQQGDEIRRVLETSSPPLEWRFVRGDGMLQSVDLMASGILAVRFRYERHANGSVKRTLAYSPAGQLIGEYSGVLTYLVARNGAPVDYPMSIARIYKLDAWW